MLDLLLRHLASRAALLHNYPQIIILNVLSLQNLIQLVDLLVSRHEHQWHTLAGLTEVHATLPRASFGVWLVLAVVERLQLSQAILVHGTFIIVILSCTL